MKLRIGVILSLIFVRCMATRHRFMSSVHWLLAIGRSDRRIEGMQDACLAAFLLLACWLNLGCFRVVRRRVAASRGNRLLPGAHINREARIDLGRAREIGDLHRLLSKAARR